LKLATVLRNEESEREEREGETKATKVLSKGDSR